MSVVGLITFLPNLSYAEPKPPTSSNPPRRGRPGLPNSFARDYKLDRHLTDRSENSRDPRESVDVIVTLNPGQDLTPQFRRYVCGPRLDIINGYALCHLPVNLLKQLASNYSVHRAHYNRPAHEADILSSSAIQADLLAQQFAYTGAGVSVAFIDSGLTRQSLPDLADDRVLQFVDFVQPSNRQRIDESGHGTHVAGVVAGTGALDPKYAGIAPDAKVVSLRVLDEAGRGTIGDIIAAMDWVAKNAAVYHIRVVNLSVGAGVYESYWTDPLTLAAKVLVDSGITVVAAAGNFGKNASGESQFGGITAPGVAPWVLTVCAFSTLGTPQSDDDALAAFSSSGPTAFDFTAKPDVCAPGVGIVSVAAPEGELYRRGNAATPSWLIGSSPNYPYQPYLSLTGTSQATPFVTGTVALMLQANPNLTPNLIKAILQYTATSKPGVSPLSQGAGFMNTLGAVQLARFYAHAAPGTALPIDPSWSEHIIWGNHMLSGGVLDPAANAWMPGVEWGWAKTQGDTGANIVWGRPCTNGDCDNIIWRSSDDDGNIVWGTSDEDDGNIVWGTDDDGNIVWGTADDDGNIVWGTGDDDGNIVWGTGDDDGNIVWGTGDDDDGNIVWGTGDDDDGNIVWGTDCGGADCDNVVWGTADDDGNIVWGTADDDANIVWGTGDDDGNIVWGTGDDDGNIVWGTGDDDGNIVWGTNDRDNVVWPIYR